MALQAQAPQPVRGPYCKLFRREPDVKEKLVLVPRLGCKYKDKAGSVGKGCGCGKAAVLAGSEMDLHSTDAESSDKEALDLDVVCTDGREGKSWKVMDQRWHRQCDHVVDVVPELKRKPSPPDKARAN